MVLWPRVVDAVAPMPVLGAGGVGRGRQTRGGAGARLRRRVVRLGLAEDRAERGHARDQAEMFEAGAGRRGADAHRHRQALPHAAQQLHRRLGRPARPTLPAPLQALLWWGQGRTRVERVRAKEFLTYPVGQIVAT
jgi:hypothetical protein